MKRKINIEDIKDWIFSIWLCTAALAIILPIIFILGCILTTINITIQKMLPPRTIERVEKLVELLSPEQKEQYDKWYKER